MRILTIQFTPATRGRSVPRFEPLLGTLLSLLKSRGHEVSLLGVSRFDVNALKRALAQNLPQLVYADLSPVCVDAARRTLEHIGQHEFLPVVAGGAFATIDPAGVLSLPAVLAAAIGEPDASLVTYLERIKDPAVRQVVHGVWLRDERGLARPDLAHLVEDLDSLPAPERELFGYDAHVARSGELEIAVGRGCPQTCDYCLNPAVAGLYSGRGTWVRRRSPASVLAEVAALRQRYPEARSVRFLDHAFALHPGWLGAFLDAWRAERGPPFRCHLRANAADAEVVSRLAAAGCRMVDVEVISGSDFIRNEIFRMELSNAQIEETARHVRNAGIRLRAIVYAGAPYESEMSLEETRDLLRAIRPDLADIRPYYPWPGTAARETARENGWLHPRGEEQLHGDLPGLDIPACRPERVATFVRKLRAELAGAGGAWWRRWRRQGWMG